MPIIKSAKKAMRQTEKRTAHNQQIKKDIKTAIKAFKKTPTGENLSKAQSELDKAVKKNLLKKNTVARKKAALAKIAKNSKSTTTKKTAAKKTTKKATTKKAPAKKTSKVTKAKAE